jgi:hypothetical protein
VEAKLDKEADESDKASVTIEPLATALGKRKERTDDSEPVMHAEHQGIKHENARARSIQTYQTKGNTMRGLSRKAAKTSGGGKISNKELQMRLARKIPDRKDDEPLTLAGQSFFVEGTHGFPRCRACKKQVDKYELRGIVFNVNVVHIGLYITFLHPIIIVSVLCSSFSILNCYMQLYVTVHTINFNSIHVVCTMLIVK